jgi:hypothetical protein
VNQNFNDMTRTAARHFSGISFNSSLGAALVAVALAGIIVLSGAASVISSAFAGSIKDSQPKEVIDELVVQHDAKMKEFQERFNKRYVFFKPPPPPPARPKQPPKDEEPIVVEPPKETGPPATYPGPSIVWVIGDDVYFNDATPSLTQKYLRVKVGEEKEGVKVINVDNVPRSVRVGHSGGEYDVKVFGDSMQYATLFPATPRASILNPNLIPAPEQAAPPSSPPELEAPPVVAEGAAAAADGGRGGRNRLTATPAKEQPAKRGRANARDEEARRKAEAAGDKPAEVPAEEADAAEDAEADQADDEADGEGEGEPDGDEDPKPDVPSAVPGAVPGA